MDEDMKNQELSGSVNDIEAAAGELVHETADTVIYDPIAGTPAPDEEIKAPEIEDVPSAEAVEVVAESTLDAASEAAVTAEDATEAVEAATEEAAEVATETVEAIAEPSATEEAEEITPAPAPVKTGPAAPGTAGEFKLYDTDPRDAAMAMAIIADTLHKPLNELRFISIREVK